jgi:RNA polymerase sigma factor (TIGR02999 family)
MFFVGLPDHAGTGRPTVNEIWHFFRTTENLALLPTFASRNRPDFPQLYDGGLARPELGRICMSLPPVEVTQLLQAWGEGDRAALDQLMPVVYSELRQLAQHYLRGERQDHSLQTTALVNEAYLRLIKVQNVQWQDRAHFFAISSRLIRQILVDRARHHGYQKRGGKRNRVELEESAVIDPGRDGELLALDEALEALAKFDERKSRVVELRFFGGLSLEEAAAVLEVSPDTVRRDWRLSKSWLRKYLSEEGADES